ncbi:MAG: Brp/Blh family beta-carotene 15,15'-dioxygenase [Chloroflexota bacterium]
MSAANPKLIRAIFHFAWLSIIVLLVLEWLGLSLTGGWEYVPFVVSMLFLGLPHGAIDHLVPYRLKNRSFTLRSLVIFLLGYILIAGFYGVLWWWATAASAVFFILLTWFHWGQGELYIVEKFISPGNRRFWRSLLLIIVRGGLPMLVPLFAFPTVYLDFVNEMISIFGPSQQITVSLGALEPFITSVQWIYILVTALYLLIEVIDASQNDLMRGWYIDTAEIGLLWLFFSFVNPILAVGVYFCVWHSIRHIARLLLIDTASAKYLEEGHFWMASFRFFRDSAPLTIVSLLFLGGLYFAIGTVQASTQELIALYLVLISMLTLPHTLVVCWMDYRENTWLLRY